MSRLSNLTSGLIGAVVGALIGFGGSLVLVMLNLFLDLAVDNEAAKKELANAEAIIEQYIQDNDDFPTYKLLNTEIEWKSVIIDVNDDEFSQMYYQLVKLDTLRELVLNNAEGEDQRNLILAYKKNIIDLHDDINFQDQIIKLNRIRNHRYDVIVPEK